MNIGIIITVAYLCIGILLARRRVEDIAVDALDFGVFAAAFRIVITWPFWVGQR